MTIVDHFQLILANFYNSFHLSNVDVELLSHSKELFFQGRPLLLQALEMGPYPVDDDGFPHSWVCGLRIEWFMLRTVVARLALAWVVWRLTDRLGRCSWLL